MRLLGNILFNLITALVELLTNLINRVLQGISAFFSYVLTLMIELPKHFGIFPQLLISIFAVIPDEFIMLMMFGVVLIVIVAVKKRLIG
jgi:hypothetical protein